jgi:hypothetical protein
MAPPTKKRAPPAMSAHGTSAGICVRRCRSWSTTVVMKAPIDGPRPVARGFEKRTKATIRKHQGRRSNVLRASPHAREPPPWDDLQVEPTVVIVDDHAGFRARAAALLEDAGYHVVGSCADGRSALSLLSTLRPDVVVLDVQRTETSHDAVVRPTDSQVDRRALANEA